MTVTVGDLMRRRFDSVGPGEPMAEAMRVMMLMSQEALPVVDGDRLVGMIAERDAFEWLFRELSQDLHESGLRSVDFEDLDNFHRLGAQPVGELMSTRLVTATSDMPTLRAAGLMRARRIRRLPVIEGDRLVGIVFQADILADLLRRSAKATEERSRQAADARPHDVPVLLLTTTGRKSGEPRTRALMYVADGGSFAVVASNSGRPSAPAWWLNLRSDPHATVQVAGASLPVVAEEASPEERARLWPRIVKMNPVYEGLQESAHRELPVVVLRPVHTAAASSDAGTAGSATARLAGS